jgi:hypothetical protein
MGVQMQMITRYSLIPLGNFRVSMKMLDNNINLEGLFTICLYTFAEEGKNGMEYHFLTNRYKKRPAKSPMGMFDDTMIPNDLQLVSNKIEEYYS